MEWEYQCACCGEANTVFLEEEHGRVQEVVEDCAVCCRPMVIRARWNMHAEGFDLEVYQEDLG